jgi:hypothetical protein
MPRQQNIDLINHNLQKYGYMIQDDSYPYRNNKTKLKLYNYITNKTQYYSYNQIQRQIRSGKIVEVDPYINTFGPIDEQLLYVNNINNGLLSRLEYYVPDNFNSEPLPIKTETLKLFKQFVPKMFHHQNFSITATGNPTIDKASLFAMVALIRNFKFDDSHRAVLNIYHEGYDEPEFKYINPSTAAYLDDIITKLFYDRGVDNPHNTDSDVAILLVLSKWTKMEVIFEQIKPKIVNILENVRQTDNHRHRVAGGFFPYLNTSGVNLEKFGIYSSFSSTNYKESCLIHAIDQSGKVSIPDMDLLRSVINCRIYPIVQLNKISELIHVNVTLEKWNEKENTYDTPKKYIIDTSYPTIPLLLRYSHYFLDDIASAHSYYIDNKTIIDNEPRINQNRKTLIRKYEPNRWQYGNGQSIKLILQHIIKAKLISPLTDNQDNQAVRAFELHPSIIPLTLSTYTYTEMKQSDPKSFNLFIDNEKILKEWLTIDPPEPIQVFNEFCKIIREEFDLCPWMFKSLAQLGQAILYKTKCYEGCYQLTGHIASFIRQCCVGPMVKTAYDKKYKITGDIIQIDKNSSYPSVYRDFSGIPSGPPQLISHFDPDQLTYYYILINVKSFICKHSSDPFPLISSCGNLYLDKTTFDLITSHYELNYEFIIGISFNSFNKNVRTISERLYYIRQQYKAIGSHVQHLLKRLLNSLWGKSIQKPRPTYKVEIAADKIDNFKAFNEDFIYSMQQKGNIYECHLIKPLMQNWSLPQFASNVLSYSLKEMSDLIYSAVDLGCEIYYVNTDSLTLSKEHFNILNEKYNLLSSDLGKFSIEVESSTFYTLGPYKNLHILKDNTARVRYHSKLNNPIEFFEDKLNQSMKTLT